MTPQQLLQHADSGRLWPPADGSPAFDDLPAAYRAALDVRALRVARGERPAGYKIGFTNRSIWPRYQVFAPIWGTVWNTSLSFCDGDGNVSLDHTCQPRIEPEAVFGFKATPPADPSVADLFDVLAWVAPGFEIVQSHRPDWKFGAAETVADGGLHARLVVGPRAAVDAIASDAQQLHERLAMARVSLSKDGATVDEGIGANVLDSPLQALLHFVRELQHCPGAPGLQPGDVVTTGTWTDAWPVAPGEQWHAAFTAPLLPLQLRFR